MKRKHLTNGERLIRIETLMENHLAHHDRVVKYFLAPITVGIVLSIIGIGFTIFKLHILQ